MDKIASEASPLGAAVREALAVIDRAVSYYGYGARCACTPGVQPDPPPAG